MAGERILVIDDSKQVISFLAQQVLPTLGYAPLIATTGRKGLEVAARESPDLILLDLNLPDMSGLDLLRNLNQQGGQIPVILMTAYGSEQVAVEAFRLGVRDYLTKPFEAQEVIDAIERALAEPRLRQDRSQLSEELRRANQALQRQVQQIITLSNIGRTITATLDVNQVLEQVMDAAIFLCRAEEATVWLLDEKTKMLMLVAEKGQQQESFVFSRLPMADSLAGEAIRTRRPLQRVAAHDRPPIKIKTGYLVQSVLYLPMMLRDRGIGVLAVAYRTQPHVFTEWEQFLLSTLADYAAIAVENARLYQQTDKALSQRLRELTALNDVARTVNASLDLDRILQHVIEVVQEMFDVESASVWLMDSDRKRLLFAISADVTAAMLYPMELPVGRGIVGYVAQHAQSALSNDVREDPRFYGQVDVLTGFETRSILAVPLVARQQVIGVIELVNRRSGPFTQDDLERLEAIAGPVAVAVDNARLFAQVERERATLRAMLDNALNPMFICNDAGEILMLNPAAASVLSVSPQEAVGRPLAEVVACEKLEGLVRDTLEVGQARTEEGTVDNRTYLLTAAPIPDVGMMLEMQDITYLKELDRAKSDFVSIVSHDLRSPLTSILGFAKLLKRIGPLNERQERYVQQIIEVTWSMEALINNLLDLARIEAGLDEELEPCSLDEIAAQVVEEMQGVAAEREIRLRFAVRRDLPRILGRPMRLRQVVSNLVGNALKYTPPGGQVLVGLDATDTHLRMSVADTGLGIPPQDLPHIFEKFYRVQDAEHASRKGTGLGLALVKSIVESHGGQVVVKSQVGKGTIFTVILPIPDGSGGAEGQTD